MSAIPISTLLEEAKCYACYAPADVPTLASMALLSRIAADSEGIVARTLTTFSRSGVADGSFTTDPIEIRANELILVAVSCSSYFATPTTFTVSGGGLTWVQVEASDIGVNSPPNDIVGSMAVFRSMSAADITAAIQVDVAFTQENVIVNVIGFLNVDTSGTFGSGAIVSSDAVAGLTANPSISVPALDPSGLNTVVAWGGNVRNPYAGAAESGWSKTLDTGTTYNSPLGMLSISRGNCLDSTVVVTAAAEANGLICVQVKAAP